MFIISKRWEKAVLGVTLIFLLVGSVIIGYKKYVELLSQQTEKTSVFYLKAESVDAWGIKQSLYEKKPDGTEVKIIDWNEFKAMWGRSANAYLEIPENAPKGRYIYIEHRCFKYQEDCYRKNFEIYDTAEKRFLASADDAPRDVAPELETPQSGINTSAELVCPTLNGGCDYPDPEYNTPAPLPGGLYYLLSNSYSHEFSPDSKFIAVQIRRDNMKAPGGDEVLIIDTATFKVVKHYVPDINRTFYYYFNHWLTPTQFRFYLYDPKHYYDYPDPDPIQMKVLDVGTSNLDAVMASDFDFTNRPFFYEKGLNALLIGNGNGLYTRVRFLLSKDDMKKILSGNNLMELVDSVPYEFIIQPRLYDENGQGLNTSEKEVSFILNKSTRTVVDTKESSSLRWAFDNAVFPNDIILSPNKDKLAIFWHSTALGVSLFDLRTLTKIEEYRFVHGETPYELISNGIKQFGSHSTWKTNDSFSLEIFDGEPQSNNQRSAKEIKIFDSSKKK